MNLALMLAGQSGESVKAVEVNLKYSASQSSCETLFLLASPGKGPRTLKNCPTCKAEIENEYSFCNTCGTPLFLAPIDDSGSRARRKRLTSILAYAGEMLGDIIVTILSGV